VTDDQAQQMIAYMYSNGEQVQAVGHIAGQCYNWLAVIAILLLVLVFAVVVRRA